MSKAARDSASIVRKNKEWEARREEGDRERGKEGGREGGGRESRVSNRVRKIDVHTLKYNIVLAG